MAVLQRVEDARQGSGNEIGTVYSTECEAVNFVRVFSSEILIACSEDDEHGKQHYLFRFERDGASAQAEQALIWRADRLLEAIKETQQNPNAVLELGLEIVSNARVEIISFSVIY